MWQYLHDLILRPFVANKQSLGLNPKSETICLGKRGFCLWCDNSRDFCPSDSNQTYVWSENARLEQNNWSLSFPISRTCPLRFLPPPPPSCSTSPSTLHSGYPPQPASLSLREGFRGGAATHSVSLTASPEWWPTVPVGPIFPEPDDWLRAGVLTHRQALASPLLPCFDVTWPSREPQARFG